MPDGGQIQIHPIRFPRLKINRIIQILIYSDFLFYSAFGLLGPIFAIFISEQIQGGSAQVAGFASTFYWGVKSVLQIPAARYVDNRKGERDDYWLMVMGYALSAVVPFFYLWVTLPWHLYLLQAILGVAAAISFPGWFAIFTRHIDRYKEGLEWSFHSVMIGAAFSVAGALGGMVAQVFGFRPLFITVGVVSIMSTFSLLIIRRDILRSDKESGLWKDWDNKK